MRAGFTLVEVLVAVAIASLLIVGVLAATQSTVQTAQRQKSDAAQEEQRARAIELLRQDWRGRVTLLKPTLPPPAGSQNLLFSTTADAVASVNRATRLVTYTVSEKGLSRKEGNAESVLLPAPILLDFWDGIAWRPTPEKAPPAIRLTLQGPEETIVLR